MFNAMDLAGISWESFRNRLFSSMGVAIFMKTPASLESIWKCPT